LTQEYHDHVNYNPIVLKDNCVVAECSLTLRVEIVIYYESNQDASDEELDHADETLHRGSLDPIDV
jgi:hypothetical protein